MRLSLAVLMAASAGLAPRAQDVSAPAVAPSSYAAVAPILERCAECHGAQRQRKGLRVDAREALLRGGRSGPAVVPGRSADSILLQRVSGIGKRMPPTGDALSATEIAALRAWIDAGVPMPERAPVDPRPWAHRPMSPPMLPASGLPPGPVSTHPIDVMVRARLQEAGSAVAGLAPAPSELRSKLLRRVSLDLIGLPPSAAAVDAHGVFADADSPAAFTRAVDHLLASPHFGERWAAMWLDLARYADTKGYEKDDRRSIWRYRDWVIDAFNQDLPFDQFTIKQLAGDLLPNPTQDDLIATAFHRNTMTNDEGGTDNEEFRVAAVVDRVNTTMSVWMGTTLGCCQCHDHKYDPFSQREYYQLFAFFDNTQDDDHESERPVLEAPTAEVRDALAVRRQLRAELTATLRADTPERQAARAKWLAEQERALVAFDRAPPRLSAWQQSPPYPGRSLRDAHARAFAPETGDAAAWQAVAWQDVVYADAAVHELQPGDNAAVYLTRTVHLVAPQTLTLSCGSDDAVKLFVDGKEVLAELANRAAARDQARASVALAAGEHRILLKIVNGGGPSGFAFELRALPFGDAVLAALRKPEAARSPADHAQLKLAWEAQAPELLPVRTALASVEAELAAIAVPTVPILRERAPHEARVTRVHRRGNFLDQGEPVERRTPAALHAFPADAPRDRLGLARWIVAPDNPLTARVFVNRVWEQLFGVGLVDTSDDFGVQSEPPSHPALLDWLALDFMQHGWSVKHLLRTIVTSATYQQSSAVGGASFARDPDNRWLTRGPRGRLSAEAVRDQALALAGLLSPKLGGPSVMPHQPDGVWTVIYSNDEWRTSSGEDRYRRGLYTFWRRTSPYPSMLAFDAPSREFCVVKRTPTNTPLQALVTLNDPVFVEAAHGLAARMQAEGGADVEARITWAFHACTGRHPAPAERQRLLQLYLSELERGGAEPGAAKLGAAAERAYRVLANVLLNLDETLTKG